MIYNSCNVYLLNNLPKIMETYMFDSIFQPYIQLFLVTLPLVKPLYPRDLDDC